MYFLTNFFDGLRRIEFSRQQQMKGVMKRVDRLTRVTTPARAHFVQAVAFRVIADRKPEGQRVLYHD